MSKLLYCGVQKNSSGYGKACRENILALDQAGVDVVCRHIQMTPNMENNLDKRLLELESKDLNNISTIIQHNLPNTFSYKGGVQNIGAFAYETNQIPRSWFKNLVSMDKLIVFCEHQKKVLNSYGLNNVFVVPHPVDISKFDRKNSEIFGFGFPANTIKFYTIAEFGRRKNFPALISAYFSRFCSMDNVVLVIKTHIHGKSSSETMKLVASMIEDIKAGANRFKNPEMYPKVIVITDYMSEDDISNLHRSCDIFVTASHSESFCLPAIDALGFGNPVIAPNFSAFEDYIPEDSIRGIAVNCIESPVFGMIGAPDDLYGSDETWANVNIKQFADAMSSIVHNNRIWLSDQAKKQRTDFVKDNYSREVIGKKLVEVIEY